MWRLLIMQNSFKPERIVVKFGGAALADGEKVSKAAKAVAKEASKGKHIAVVVSAMGKTTDALIEVAKNACNGNVNAEELDDILAMGERTSVRIFTAALKSYGLKARYFDPADPEWPIITDDSFLNANPIIELCEEKIQRFILPLFEKKIIPVMPGFIGKTIDGKITTLGRGGSDTTAFILAKGLKANEVILVTDADGIMTADPKIVKNPRRISEIDVQTLVGLADSGTKFIHRKALKYKDPSINVRVINHASGDLNQEGTIIRGELPKDLEADIVSPFPVASIRILGKKLSERPEIVGEFIENIRKHTVLLGMSLDENSLVSFVAEKEDLQALAEGIHQIVLNHREAIAMSIRRNLAFLRIKGVGLEETPGIIGRISEPLRLNNINIFGILTNTSSILLFVSWDDRERALNLIKCSLGLEGR
ncbi:MAG: aspartate kinase [Candidatus Bathyarchaeia archaeon]